MGFVQPQLLQQHMYKFHAQESEEVEWMLEEERWIWQADIEEEEETVKDIITDAKN